MAPSVLLLCILFGVGFLFDTSIGIQGTDLGLGFTIEPQDVIGLRGKSVELHCKPWTLYDIRVHNITWLRDDVAIDLENDTRRTLHQDGTLTIRKVKHKRPGTTTSDQGYYSCLVATNIGSLLSRPAHLQIASISHNFTRHPKSELIEEGAAARLSCSIESVPYAEITWYHDDTPITQDNNKYMVLDEAPNTSVLYVTHFSVEDSGKYKCSAINVVNKQERTSSEGELAHVGQKRGSRQLVKFQSQQLNTTRYVKTGDNVRLDCSTSGSYQTKLSWSILQQGSDKVTSIGNVSKSDVNINILHLSSSKIKSGVYECIATDEQHDRASSQKTKVQVVTELNFVNKSLGSRVLLTAKTVRLRCDVSGQPIADVAWYKDGQLLTYNNGRVKHKTSVNATNNVRISELLLSSTITNDSGIYQCLAGNEYETIWSATRLYLNTSSVHPNPPENVTCSPVSESQVLVVWDKPSDMQQDYKAFSVHYSLTEGGEEWQQVTTNRSLIVDKLSPFTNYSFSVRVYADLASDFSIKATCQTKEEVPIAAPVLTLERVSPNSVRVSWTPLPNSKSRGIVTEYKIQWRISHSTYSNVDQVKGDVVNYVITGLSGGKEYDVRVLAATSKGWPQVELPWTKYEMKKLVSSNTPSAPVIQGTLNSTTLTLEWSLNTPVPIDGYKLYYRKQNSDLNGPFKLPINRTQYLLNSLDADTSYEVMVLGYNHHGDGETGRKMFHTLSTDNPSSSETSYYQPPGDVEAEPTSSSSIRLTWARDNVTVTHYTICYNQVQTSLNLNNSSIQCTTSNKNEAEVKQLKPYTLYEFRVKKHDLYSKQSVYSQTVECHTLEDVPSLVRDVEWSVLNRTSVRVRWKEPTRINGVIRYYSVGYVDQDVSLSFDKWTLFNVPANKHNVDLTGLKSNVNYKLGVGAATGAGLGNYTVIPYVIIKSIHHPAPTTVSVEVETRNDDQHVGIIVGVSIGMCCIIACLLSILCKKRCVKLASSTDDNTRSGNGCRQTITASHSPETHEMEMYSCDMLSSETQTQTTSQHIDTKGHLPNGLRLPTLGNGRISNGFVPKGTIHIIENPRYDLSSPDSPLLGLQRSDSSQGRNTDDTHDRSDVPLLSSPTPPLPPPPPLPASHTTTTRDKCILENPEFRFSDNDKIIIKQNGRVRHCLNDNNKMFLKNYKKDKVTEDDSNDDCKYFFKKNGVSPISTIYHTTANTQVDGDL